MLSRINRVSLFSSTSFLWRIKLREEDPSVGQKCLFAQYIEFTTPYEIAEKQFYALSLNLGALDIKKNSSTDKLQGVVLMEGGKVPC